MATTPDVATAAAMTRSTSWMRLFMHIAIAVVVFIVANVITYQTSGFYQKEQEYQDSVAGIARHPHAQVIFSGDSHFAVPLNDYLNPNPNTVAYSVAWGGDSLRESFAKVRYALEHTSGIDTLILTADPHMFGKGRLESSNRLFCDWYFIADWDSSGVQHHLWSAMLQQVPLFSEDFLQYFRKDLGVWLSNQKPHARAGDDPLAWSRLTDEERTRSAIDTGRSDHDGAGDLEQPFVWYLRILDVARAHHVKVIGVRFPVNPGYAAQAPADKVAKIDAYLLSHGVTQIIDLRNTLTDPRQFEDEDHVNENGAPVVVKMLEERLGRKLGP